MTKLRVWWIPQLDMEGEPFMVYVENLVEAKPLLNTLGLYDLYQFENKVKGDYSNVGNLNYWDEEEWFEWFIPDNVIEYLDDWSLENIKDLTIEQIRELTKEGLL